MRSSTVRSMAFDISSEMSRLCIMQIVVDLVNTFLGRLLNNASKTNFPLCLVFYGVMSILLQGYFVKFNRILTRSRENPRLIFQRILITKLKQREMFNSCYPHLWSPRTLLTRFSGRGHCLVSSLTRENKVQKKVGILNNQITLPPVFNLRICMIWQ